MGKKSKIILTILLLIEIFIFNLHNCVIATEKASLNISITSDSTDLKSTKKLYYNIGLNNVKNIDTTMPTGLEATLEYDSTILSNPTISGASNWSAQINQKNNKIVVDCNSFTPDETIATIAFDANIPSGTTTTIKIALLNVTLAIDNVFYLSAPRIDSGTVTITTNSDNTSSSTLPVTGEETSTSTKVEYELNNNLGDNTTIANTINNTRGETVFNLVMDDKGTESKPSEITTQKVNSIEPVKDATTSNTPLPQAGVSYIIYIAIGIVVVIGIYTFIRDKKFYD